MSLSRYKKIIIHCGIHKTGSSYLQQILSQSSGLLHRWSIHYPQFVSDRGWRHGGNHSVVALLYRQGEDIERHIERFLDLDSNCSTLLLSGEEFSRVGPIDEFLQRLRVSANGAELKFVFYLRRPDHLIESVYAESVKDRLYGDISRAAYQLNFLEIVRPFVNAVGKSNVIVRPYNRKKWPSHELGADFCEAIGAPTLWQDLEPPDTVNVNASLSRAEIFLLSRVRPKNVKRLLLQRYEREPLQTGDDTSKFFRSPEERRRLNAAHRPHLRRLGELFDLGDIDDFFDLANYEEARSWTPFRPAWEALLSYLVASLDEVVENPVQK